MLDRLLDADGLEFGAVCGTSAGALNAAVLADHDGLAPLNPSSQLNTDRRFLEQLHALGRQAAGRWLAAHRDDVGVRGTLDIEAVFLRRR